MTDTSRRRKPVLLAALLSLLILSPACTLPLIHKKKAIPPPPAAPAAVTPAPPAQPREVVLPAAPEISPAEPDLSQRGPSTPGESLPPAPRRRSKPAHPRQDDEAETPAAPAPDQPPPQQAVPLPRLEQILTPEQRQAYNEEIERNISNAQRAVAALESRRLDRDQLTYLARVRAFIDQANEARRGDLFRARNLAERARVLAEDLLKSVQ